MRFALGAPSGFPFLLPPLITVAPAVPVLDSSGRLRDSRSSFRVCVLDAGEASVKCAVGAPSDFPLLLLPPVSVGAPVVPVLDSSGWFWEVRSPLRAQAFPCTVFPQTCFDTRSHRTGRDTRESSIALRPNDNEPASSDRGSSGPNRHTHIRSNALSPV